MSVICQTFVQNAWRSDLCSNCFKCLDDHSAATNTRKVVSAPRYMPQATALYQSRGISSTLKWRLSEPIYDRVARRDFGSQTTTKTSPETDQSNKGILVKKPTPDKKLRSRPSVDFSSEEALVIGYGGNDYDSDQSPWEMGSDDGSIDLDLLNDTDEDRKISRLTKNNTEFNSSNQNLLEEENTKTKHLNLINNLKTSSTILKQNDFQLKPNSAILQQTNLQLKLNSVIPQQNDVLHKTSLVTDTNNLQRSSEKKLDQYYFSTSIIEPVSSYLHNNSPKKVENQQRVSCNNGSKKEDLRPYTKSNEQLVSKKVDNNNRNGPYKNILRHDFTPLNTRTYSFVSELNKNSGGSEHNSDSDYSTCRLTPGDSTDSESFQDAEEPSRIIPCSSFLHGNFPRDLQKQSSTNSLDSDKKYDGGSSTSGDVSNLSDDSDTHENTEKTPCRTRNLRPKISNMSESNLQCKDSNTQSIFKKRSPESNIKQSHSESIISDPERNRNIKDESPKHNASNVSKLLIEKLAENSKKSSTGTKNLDVRIGSSYQMPPSEINQKAQLEPRPPVDINLRNIIAVNGSSVNSVETSNKENTSSPMKKPIRKTNSSEISSSISTHDDSLRSYLDSNRPVSDEEDSADYDRTPEAINNRQSKLAALALELEMARRDSANNNSISPQTPPALPTTTPPEVKAKLTPRNSVPLHLSENYITIKKGNGVSCASRLTNTSLPDVLQETTTTTSGKLKKNRFSLKKLLKRNKDFTPPVSKDNPKAWKKQTFDRNRLSLEIVHPMDLAINTSGDSTPTEEGHYGVSSNPGKGVFRTGYSRARSLSALPQLSGDDQSSCALLECRKMDTLPARKAGTVAERKKNRPALVRTPSCSALPNKSCDQKSPPPKPPPPPLKGKAVQPPPLPVARVVKAHISSPARPPPPKIPEEKTRKLSNESSKLDSQDPTHIDKEYANLGDIRSVLTPMKPQRPSAVSANRDGETENRNVYESMPEEDHYTYLDDAEIKRTKPKVLVSGEEEHQTVGRPWLDLQTSYAAIAAANYESLAEIITTSINESSDSFKVAGKSLKWTDFTIESTDPEILSKDKVIYRGRYKLFNKDKVILMVTPKRTSVPQNTRHPVRYPVLASFSDNLLNGHNPSDSDNSSIYVLKPSRISNLKQFSENASSEKSNQHVHLRDYCFVLLQVIHTLKGLQAEGIEEVNYDLEQLVMVTTNEDKPPIFVLFPEDKAHLTLSDSGRKTLCQATLNTMYNFLGIGSSEELTSCKVNGENLMEPVAHTFRAIAKVLSEEKASSLSQAKGFLEYMLWGPVDVTISGRDEIIDVVLQRWLDLQRAQMVKSTISLLQGKSQQQLHVYEEYQLVFLLQASVKTLKSVISKL